MTQLSHPRGKILGWGGLKLAMFGEYGVASGDSMSDVPSVDVSWGKRLAA